MASDPIANQAMASDPIANEAKRESRNAASPGKKTAPLPLPPPPEAVAGSETWPALLKAKTKGTIDIGFNKTPVSPSPNVAAAAPPPQRMQAPFISERTNGFGSNNFSNKHHHPHSHKHGPNHNSHSNGMMLPPVPSPYNKLPTQPMFYHPVQPSPPLPPLMAADYSYPAFIAPFPTEPYMFIPHMPSTIHTGQFCGFDISKSFEPSPRGDFSYYDTNSHFNQTWYHPRAFGRIDNMSIPNGIGTGGFIRPGPQFLGQVPGYNNVPGFPGHASKYNAHGPPPREIIRGPPRVGPRPASPANHLPVQKTVDLSANIVKQIDYYFSDENLQRPDEYLLKLMDEHGWVSIHIVAGFRRVKKMTTDLAVILEALQSSKSIEVQDDKIRGRNNWSKWVPASRHPATPNSLTADVQIPTSIGSDNDTDKCLSSAREVSGSEDNSGLDQSVADTVLSANDTLTCNGKNEGNMVPTLTSNPVQSKGSVDSQDLVGLSNGVMDVCPSFDGEPGSFLLNKELESENTTMETDRLSSNTRIDDEDDLLDANDQDVQRLIIVTQGLSQIPGQQKTSKETQGVGAAAK